MATNEKIIWDYLKSQIKNDYGVAGVMGNLYAESVLNPKNLQSTYEKKLGYTDETYTQAVDNGTYTNFINDAAGYGLAQWTYWSLKRDMLEYFQKRNKSIGDLQTQIEFLVWQLSNQYPSVWKDITNATSILEASNSMLLKFERPADQSVNMQNKRAQYGQTFYDKYSKEKKDTVGINKYKKGQLNQISTNFKSTEFDCQGRNCCSETLIDSKLIEIVQKIRDHFKKPVRIGSGYRCPIHNANISNAASKSKHMDGMAADISISGVAPSEIAKYAESIGVLGIGLYETAADGYFVHVDTRTTKSFWYGHAQKRMTTFGGNPPKKEETPAIIIALRRGGSGQEVKDLQEKLNSLGYNCGTADGIFGSKTEAAVRKFQSKHNLTPDGIFGKNTYEVLNKVLKNSYNGKVSASLLNVRKGPGTNHSIVAQIKKDVKYKISQEKSGWGEIDGLGWVSLNYIERV